MDLAEEDWVQVGAIRAAMGLPTPRTGKLVKHLIRTYVCVYLGSCDPLVRDGQSCEHAGRCQLPRAAFHGSSMGLSQSRVGDLCVGKRPPNAEHSPSLRRVFSSLLPFARGFLNCCLLVVRGAIPGPQVCACC